jgi:hypothetical protein
VAAADDADLILSLSGQGTDQPFDRPT